MPTVVVLTGARGAGKTTAVRRVSSLGVAHMLKPFTTREPRASEDDEYHFVKRRPPAESVAWTIQVGTHWYGMQMRELDGIPLGQVGLTVFDPDKLGELKQFRDANPGLEIVIVGLDTVATSAEQLGRIGDRQERQEDQARIDRIRGIVQSTDIVLRGDQDTIAGAISVTCRLLSGRGGIVAKHELVALIRAGCLLRDAELDRVQSASYDLALGDEVWCQGVTSQLSASNPVFKIPAYSYAIVKATETAAMPAFIAGQFDVRVGHFLSGVVLSNGPQVDPGYWGELFCMLFNASSDAKAIRRGDHFATLHFWTTTRNTEAYSGFYLMKEKLANHMRPEVSTGLGGQIEQVVDRKVAETAARLRGEMPKDHSSAVLGFSGLMVAIVLAVVAYAVSAGNDANKAAAEARQAIEVLSEAMANLPSLPPAPAQASPAPPPIPETQSGVPTVPKGAGKQ